MYFPHILALFMPAVTQYVPRATASSYHLNSGTLCRARAFSGEELGRMSSQHKGAIPLCTPFLEEMSRQRQALH